MPINCNYAVLVQEHNYAGLVDKFRSKYHRMEDVVTAIDWTIGKKPTIGTNCDGGNKHYVFKTYSIGDTPIFRILYRYEEIEGKVYLLSIQPIETEE